MPDWAMMVGLIGEGQQIHVGEEGGLEQWNEAIVKSGEEWVIHCPSHVADVFRGRRVRINDALDLTTTLRSHVAGDLHGWVDCLLKGRIADARSWADAISKEARALRSQGERPIQVLLDREAHRRMSPRVVQFARLDTI
jgi:hypothetical protein